MRRLQLGVSFLAVLFMTAVPVKAGGPGHLAPQPMMTSAGPSFGQGTPMYATYGPYEGDCCGCAAPVCGSRCCCPGVLPALVGGVGHVLKKVFCGHRFCDPCCPTVCPGVAMSDCGCDDGCDTGFDRGYDGPVLPGGPSDPFLEDPGQPAVNAPQARQYKLWNMPQPVHYRSSPGGATRVTVNSKSTPRTLTVRRAEPLPTVAESPVRASGRVESMGVRPASGNSRGVATPANPLRD